MDVLLYAAEGSNSAARVEWVLNFKRVVYTRVEVDNSQLKTDYLTVNPLGLVPCLSVDGYRIAESMAIIECLEELFPVPGVLGKTPFERAAIREVCEYVNASIHTPQNRTVLKALRPELTVSAKRELRGQWITSGLERLSTRLCLRSGFAVGEHFSAADIFVACIYQKAKQHGADTMPFYEAHSALLRQHPEVARAEP
ncbi:glutathione S-transferase family protein [Photobacterium sp. 1_MG-2023]|uniref:glutathione S-transferase family protein n=1 Tax=Photobacterium sp. 1_MG-2023 TaxID=3062646 RepID=UPI0026E30D3C|nr:glutathione S-transferase family protein [Photobacterium sp. 1_MG-2023]MDO6705130.1 glutathione S-transferase family protein [Photobacterium sp. 1_MG-2023]